MSPMVHNAAAAADQKPQTDTLMNIHSTMGPATPMTPMTPGSAADPGILPQLQYFFFNNIIFQLIIFY